LEWAKGLQEKRELVDGKIKDKNTRFDAVENEIRSIATRGALLMANPIYEKAKAILDEKREKNYIPPLVKKQFIGSSRVMCVKGWLEKS